MSDAITSATEALGAKITHFEAPVKFIITNEGAIILGPDGVRAATGPDEPAEVTFTASLDVFKAIFSGETSATVAFMSKQLTVDGKMSLAMKLSTVLSGAMP